MIYEFESPEGVRIERDFKIGTCPENITEDGIFYTRIFSVPMIQMDSDKSKFIGDMADKNTRQREKEGLVKPPPPKPFYYGDKSPKEVRKLLDGASKKEITNYIKTGKKN